jgi:HlyD family secretion protein
MKLSPSSGLIKGLPIAIAAVGVMIVALIVARLVGPHDDVTYRTAIVKRGDLVLAVSAPGTIEPEEVVDIGAQVLGMIKEFGRDDRDGSKPIDYGSPVEEGTVLARIDDALYQARVDKAGAQVEIAQAQLAIGMDKGDASKVE